MDEKIKSIFWRYLIILIFAFIGFKLAYWVFFPLTLYPVYGLLSIIFDVNLVKDVIYIGRYPIQIISACVAGSAYYFLTILNLSTGNFNLKKRFKALGISYLIFLLINIFRIFVLSLMYIFGSPYFEIVHKIFWYFLSTIFVVLIWFFIVKLYNLNEIPFYSDIKYFYKKSLFKGRKVKKQKR